LPGQNLDVVEDIGQRADKALTFVAKKKGGAKEEAAGSVGSLVASSNSGWEIGE
jgi:hypothetical protein